MEAIMTKRVLLIARTANDAKTLSIPNESDDLQVIWDHSTKYRSGDGEYENLTPDSVLRQIRMLNIDYVALDVPMYTEQLEEIQFAMEKTDAKLLEKEGSNFVEVVIPA
jgi:hypothetical protein